MNEFNGTNTLEEAEGISLQELFRIVWNNIALILIVTMWVVVLGVVYTFSIVKPKYTANTSLIVQVNIKEAGTSEQSAIVIANNLIGTFKEFIVSPLIIKSVKEDIPELANVSVAALQSSISVSTINQVLIFHVSVVNESPELAQKIANTLVNNAIEIANDENDPYEFLQNKLKIHDVADLPTSPSSPNKTLNVIISGLLGGILALGVVFMKEFFTNKYKNVDDLERHLNLRVMAAVPGTIKERKLVD